MASDTTEFHYTHHRLKFADEYIEPIVTGEKTATIRVTSDKDIHEGDRLELTDSSDNCFATATVTECVVRDAQWVVEQGVEGHKSYETVDEFFEAMSEYYPETELAPETDFMIISWGEVRQVMLDEAESATMPVGVSTAAGLLMFGIAFLSAVELFNAVVARDPLLILLSTVAVVLASTAIRVIYKNQRRVA